MQAAQAMPSTVEGTLAYLQIPLIGGTPLTFSLPMCSGLESAALWHHYDSSRTSHESLQLLKFSGGMLI